MAGDTKGGPYRQPPAASHGSVISVRLPLWASRRRWIAAAYWMGSIALADVTHVELIFGLAALGLAFLPPSNGRGDWHYVWIAPLIAGTTFGLLMLHQPVIWLAVAIALTVGVFRSGTVLVSANELRVGAERFPADAVHALRVEESTLGVSKRLSRSTAHLWLDTEEGRHLLVAAGWARDVRAGLDRLRAIANGATG